jgi:hypothetical protein
MKCICAIALLFAASLHADVTARYSTDVRFTSPVLPPGMEQAMNGGTAAIPKSYTVRVKGTKGYSNYGKFDFLIDFAKQEFTLIDPASKSYATTPAREFMDKIAGAMPQMPGDAEKIFGSMKGSFESKKTERAEAILGIQAEETEGVLTISMPTVGTEQSGPLMKMVMHTWVAKPDEVLRVAPLRELTAFTQFSSLFGNTTEMLRKMFGSIPGAEGFQSMMSEAQSRKSVNLRTRMEIQMPAMAQIAQQMDKAGKPLPPGFDPNAPFGTVNQELVELSSAPIDDAIFRMPEGFHEVPFEQIIKAFFAAQSPAPKQ